MKNRIIKKIEGSLLVFLVMLFTSSGFFSAYGTEKGLFSRAVTFDFTVATGLVNGVMGEYVNIGKPQRSELKWDMKNLVALEFAGTLGVAGRYFATLRYRHAFDAERGNVTDTDWNWRFPGSLDFSRHDAAIISYHEFEADMAFSVYAEGSLKILTGFSYLVMAFQAEARNGEDYEDGSLIGTFDGTVIRYHQNYQVVPLHVDFLFAPVRFFSLGASFSYTPFLFCSATDMHFTGAPRQQFDDRIWFGHYIRVALDLRVHLCRGIELFTRGSFRWVPRVRGDSRALDLDTGARNSFTSNTAGISLLQGSLFFGTTLHFGR